MWVGGKLAVVLAPWTVLPSVEVYSGVIQRLALGGSGCRGRQRSLAYPHACDSDLRFLLFLFLGTTRAVVPLQRGDGPGPAGQVLSDQALFGPGRRVLQGVAITCAWRICHNVRGCRRAPGGHVLHPPGDAHLQARRWGGDGTLMMCWLGMLFWCARACLSAKRCC